MKRALIFDLDNTIYPVKSIAEELFGALFNLMQQQLSEEIYTQARDEITRRPFQKVANAFEFSKELKEQGINILRDLELSQPIAPYDAYRAVKSLPQQKFLVTTGFTKMQMSKVKCLGVEADFVEIHVVDPDRSDKTKAYIFRQIMQQHNYTPEEVLVIGDDPESEIAMANELDIDTYLYDPENRYPAAEVTYRSVGFVDLGKI